METIIQTPLLATSVGFILLMVLFCIQQDKYSEDTPIISNYNLHFIMNWFTNKVPALMGGLSIVLIAVFSCSKQDTETIVDGVTATATTTLYFNPLNIQVLDAADESIFPPNATVTIGGKDKAKILSLLGERRVKLENGFIEVGVTNANKPTPAKPLEFSVLIQAPGYLDALKCFKITDASAPLQEIMKVVRGGFMPNGVSFTSKQAGLNSSGRVTADVTIAPAIGGLSITLKAGTELRNKNGVRLSGNIVKMSLWRFDATQETAIDAMPGGPSFCSATDNQNNDLSSGVFTPFGFFYATMTVNGVEAKTFSIPLEVSMTVPIAIKRTVNSLDEAPNPVRSGDVLPVWSLNESGQWVFEQMTTPAVSLRNGFNITFKASHLSSWSVADPSSPALYNWLLNGRVGAVPTAAITGVCPNAGVVIQSNLPASTGSGFYVKVRHAHNPWMTIGAIQSDLSNSNNLNLANILGGSNQKVRLEVYNSEGGANLHRTDVIVPCTRPTISLTNRVVRPANSIRFNINTTAICGTTTVFPSANIFYSEVSPSGAVRWKFLTQMVNGVASTPKLLRNVDYQFLVRRGPLSATTAQLGFPRLNFNVPVCKVGFKNADWGVDHDAEARETSPNVYTMTNLIRFPASARVCQRYSPFF